MKWRRDLKKSDIAKEFGIAQNTASPFLKNIYCKDRKQSREPDHPDVEECMLKWFRQARDRNIPLSGLLVRIKAEEFAAGLRINGFKASTGWLDGFKERNSITFKSVCVESASVNHEATNVWKDDVLQMIDENPARHF